MKTSGKQEAFQEKMSRMSFRTIFSRCSVYMDADNAHEIAAPCKILQFIYWSVGESEVVVSDLAS